MNITEDYDHFFFEAKYEFIQLSNSGLCGGGTRGSFSEARRLPDRVLTGISGELALRNKYKPRGDSVDGDGAIETADVSSDTLSVAGASLTQPTPTDLECVDAPWLIEPEDLGHFLYLKVCIYVILKNNCTVIVIQDGDLIISSSLYYHNYEVQNLRLPKK